MNDCKQTFHIFHVCISKRVKGVLMSNLRHIIHMKTKILADFQIYVSVPLKSPSDTGCPISCGTKAYSFSPKWDGVSVPL